MTAQPQNAFHAVIGSWSDTCPCCGRKAALDQIRINLAARSVARGDVTIRYPQTTFVLAQLLLAASPRHISNDEMVEALWGHRSDGGPVQAEQQIAVRIMALRTSLPKMGLRVENLHGQGYRIVDAQGVSELRGAA